MIITHFTQGSVSIASQMAWVNVLLEIIEEGLLLPLYHCLGTAVADASETRNRFDGLIKILDAGVFERKWLRLRIMVFRNRRTDDLSGQYQTYVKTKRGKFKRVEIFH